MKSIVFTIINNLAFNVIIPLVLMMIPHRIKNYVATNRKIQIQLCFSVYLKYLKYNSKYVFVIKSKLNLLYLTKNVIL